MAVGFTTSGYFTVRSLRRIAGIPAHAPSNFNRCIGKRLKNPHPGTKIYPTPAPGTGGKNDERIRDAFTKAAQGCSQGA